MKRAVALMFSLCLSFGAQADPQTRQALTFARLKSLVGVWEHVNERNARTRISFKLVAAGSALFEEWEFAGGDSSVTVYHMDDQELVATHYCPQGNQPRLKYIPGVTEDELYFQFVVGTREGLNKAES